MVRLNGMVYSIVVQDRRRGASRCFSSWIRESINDSLFDLLSPDDNLQSNIYKVGLLIIQDLGL